MTVGIGVVGAGLMGSRRARSAAREPHCQLRVVADILEPRAQELAQELGCRSVTDWRDVVADPGVDAIAVSTVNASLAPITIAALAEGKHVLCEKPLGRNRLEATAMATAAARHRRILKVGFTLRFHRAIRQARAICERGDLGPLFYIRAVYGHGGRPGYTAEWRGSREQSGGGELLDQGVHLLDLSRWFLGDFTQVFGSLGRWFWETGEVEDNAFVVLGTPHGQIASLHASWTQWRNRFLFEVTGRDGFVTVEGLGGSYGVETLTIGRRRPESGPPAEDTVRFDGPDPSWDDDWADFIDAIVSGGHPAVTGDDGVAVMGLVDAIYEGSSAVRTLGSIPQA